MKTIVFTKQAEKNFKKLPPTVKKKVNRQISLLFDNWRHSSLNTKKMRGLDRYESRIDRKHRFTFTIEKNRYVILSVGPHDSGLGKK